MTNKNNIRVLYVIPKGKGNSSFIFAKNEINSLKNEGLVGEIFLLTSRTSIVKIVKEWKRIRKKIALFKPSIIHAHYGTMTALFTILCSNLPTILTFRGSDLNPNINITWIRWFMGMVLSQLAALKAEKIICVSSQLKNRLWWMKERVVIIPSAIDKLKFYPRSQVEVRLMLGWKLNEHVVIFNARNNRPNKRLDLANSAINIARAIIGDIRFITLDGNVHHTKIPILMSAADCLLVTSDSEGSPDIVKEAIACNLPIVSTDVGDIKERIRGDMVSQIVERDPRTIGEAIAHILRLRTRSKGFEAIEEISRKNVNSLLISLYLEVIGNNK